MRIRLISSLAFGICLTSAVHVGGCSTPTPERTATTRAPVEGSAAAPSTDGTPGTASPDDSAKRPVFRGSMPTGRLNPVPLKPGGTEDFLTWIAAVPADESEVIRNQIATAANDRDVVKELISKLFELPVRDTGRHVMLLSVLGETRNAAAIEPLASFVWWKGALTTQALASGTVEPDYPLADQTELLQSRAAEMLAYLGGVHAKADEMTLKVAAAHPLRGVRIAAIDAYQWNHGDTDEAKATLVKVVTKDDAKFIGLPRKVRHMSEAAKKDFDQRVADFYKAHPEELPPPPPVKD